MDSSPPSYDHTSQSASAPPDSKEQPPSYSGPRSLISAASLSQPTTTDDSSWYTLPLEDRPTLTLDGCNIYSATHPSRVLYVLSNPPAEGSAKSVYGFEKVYYKTREDGEVKRQRQTHLYDFELSFGLTVRNSVKITGQRSSKFTFHKAILSPNGPSRASHLKSDGADKGSNLRVSPVLSDPKSKLIWKSESGKEVAIESKGTRDAGKKMVVQPRLEVLQEGLSERDVDFLVMSWCARVWMEAIKETKEPMSWDKFKRIAGAKTSKHDVARMGGFL